MRRTLLPGLAMVIALAAAAPGRADTLTIVHTGDSHSHLAPGGARDATLRGTVGGLARAATAIAGIESQEENVVTLHAGDLFVGDLFFNRYFGVPELRILSALGVDAMTLGNHEFDLTPAVLEQALDSGFDAGGFPVLSANIVFPDTGFVSLRSHVQPFTVVTAGSLRVGVFGLTTPSTNLLSQPGPIAIDDQIVATAAAMVDSLRARDCDVVVLLSHLGLKLDAAVAASVSGIDVIVGGHDHYLFEQPLAVPTPSGGTTLIVQSGPYYQNIGRLRLVIDDGSVRLLDYAIVPLDAAVAEMPQVRGMVDGMIADVEGVYGPVFSQAITQNAVDLEEVVERPLEPGFKDTPVGNLVTDAFRAATNTQIALEPSGSTAEKLYHGPIVGDDAFRAVGYGFNTVNGLGFRIVTLKVPGAALMAALEFGLSDLEAGDDFIIQTSGLTYRYDPTKPVGSRLLEVRVGATAMNPTGIYTVTTNEFALAIFQTLGLPFSDVHLIADTTEFQVLAGYLATFDTVHAAQEGRIVADVSGGVVDDQTPMPAGSIALECVPNPVTTRATLRFRLARPAHVSIELFDALGRRVATVADDVMTAGGHTAALDVAGLAGGAYLCRVNADGAARTQVIRVVR